MSEILRHTQINNFFNLNNCEKKFDVLGNEFWMGLENIYQITNNKNCTLRIILKSFESPNKQFATYKNFKLTENVIKKTLFTTYKTHG